MQRNMQPDLVDLALLMPRTAQPREGIFPARRSSHDSGDFARIFERQKMQYRRDDLHKAGAGEARSSRPSAKPQEKPQNFQADAEQRAKQAGDMRNEAYDRPEKGAATASDASTKRDSLPDKVAAQAGAETQNPADAGQAQAAQAAIAQAGGGTQPQGQTMGWNSSANGGQGTAGEAAVQPVMASQAGVSGLAGLADGVISRISGGPVATGEASSGQAAQNGSALGGNPGQQSSDPAILRSMVATGVNVPDLPIDASGLPQAQNEQGAAQAAGGTPLAGGGPAGEGTARTGVMGNGLISPVAEAVLATESMATSPNGNGSGAEGKSGASKAGNLSLHLRHAREYSGDAKEPAQAGSSAAVAGMQKGQQGGAGGQQGLPGSLLLSGRPGEALSEASEAGKPAQGNSDFLTRLIQTGAMESQNAGRAGLEAAKTAQVARPSVETVFPQIVQKAQMILRDGSSEMRMQLIPEHLGKLEMRILVHDGVVTARFMVENAQVKSMIEGNLPQLKQSLESLGLQIDSFAVGVGAGQQEAFNSSWAGSGRSSGAGDGGDGFGRSRLNRARDYDEAAPVAPIAGETGFLRSNPDHLVDARM
ncbi:MAG: flagellar hook-length control protein FliK [Firmicutes bacterium]|nr:flagellar hook-length control protein FliK [Bacillota bacterium]